MRVIKRYANRKLYDTEAKQYVTLDGIAELLRAGAEVHVVDHTSGEDLTALTLAQIIFEQEKRAGGALPHGLLARLVQAGGATLKSVRRVLATPAELARQVDAEIEQRLEALVAQGRLSAEAALRLRDQLQALGPARGAWLPDTAALEEALQTRGAASRDELRELAAQLEALAAEVDALSRGVSPGEPAGTRPSPRPAARSTSRASRAPAPARERRRRSGPPRSRKSRPD